MDAATLQIPVRWDAVEIDNGLHHIRVWLNGRRSFDLIWDPETKKLREIPIDDKNSTHG